MSHLFPGGNDTRDGTLRGQQGFSFHQTQAPSLGELNKYFSNCNSMLELELCLPKNW